MRDPYFSIAVAITDRIPGEPMRNFRTIRDIKRILGGHLSPGNNFGNGKRTTPEIGQNYHKM